jgi:GNAT superfamily N-acetyltransferase
MIEIRPCTDEAGSALSLSLFNETVPERSATLAEARAYQEAMVDTLDCVAYLDGEPAGSGLVVIEPWQRETNIAHVLLAVPPRNRRHGVGSALLEKLAAWASEQGRPTLQGWVYDADPDGIEFARNRGFVEVLRDARVALDLRGLASPSVEPPPGIEITTWAERPGLSRSIYEVACECYPDVPGGENETTPPYEDWLEHDMSGPADRPEATFLAVAGDEVVGYAKFHLPAARPTIATHELTAVKRAWRRRGVARALKQAQIAWAKVQGYERLETANELRNEGIRRLNEELGYKEIPGRALVRGQVPPK